MKNITEILDNLSGNMILKHKVHSRATAASATKTSHLIPPLSITEIQNYTFIIVIGMSLTLAACGGGGGGGGSVSSYTVGGSVSGLNNTLVIQNNAKDDLSLSQNGSFTFVTKVHNESPYSVTILTQPNGQTCSVANNLGTVSGSNITNVAIDCITNIDTTAPGVPGSPTDAGIYSSSTMVTFSWTAAIDIESGIESYNLQVGSSSGASDIFDDNVGNVLSSEVTGSNGQTLFARVQAVNGAGLTGNWSGNSNGITIDTVPPVVNITSPANGSTVSGSINVAAAATDNVLLDRVEFSIDSAAPMITDTEAPYGFSLDTITLTDATHSITATAFDASGFSAVNSSSFTVNNTVVVLPPDPVTVATENDLTVVTTLMASTEFLYTGSNPIQTGVADGTIEPLRVAVLRGKVMERNGDAIAGVAITILDHPEFGQTFSRNDGMFDMAVNGGGLLTVNYRKVGYLPVQRQVDTPWQDYIWADDVILIARDSQSTTIDLASSSPMQAARGSVVTDNDGTRQSTVFIPQGTQAQVYLADGSLHSVNSLNISLTEYTVGDSGPDAMPGKLPPTSAYTYAFDISAEEAVSSVGGKEVIINQPIPIYVDNFIGFPVGTNVPVGYYDNDRGVWVPSETGRIIQILSITDGKADVDVDGDGSADLGTLLTELGITDPERSKLAELYDVNDSLWRFRVDHFSAYDANWPYKLANDAKYAKPPKPPKKPDPCNQDGSIIECQSQVLGEQIEISGTSFSLNYRSDRVSGNKSAFALDVPLSDASVPSSLLRIELELEVAGRKTEYTVGSSNYASCNVQNSVATCTPWLPYILEPLESQSYQFTWDGKDAYGRTLQGKQRLIGRIGYTYTGGIGSGYQNSDVFGASGSQSITLGGYLRNSATLWQWWVGSIGIWDQDALGFGAWSLNMHHLYDPLGKAIYLGNGRTHSAESLPLVIDTVAGNGTPGFTGDGGPATQAQIAYPGGLAAGPDGSFYYAEANYNCIRKIDPDGIITTYAGVCIGFYGAGSYSGDGGLATQARLNEPTDVAIGADGSLYISDYRNLRIRKVDTNGIITTVAGNGSSSYGGDGVLATETGLASPYFVALGADGSLYLSTSNRIRRVGTDGIISTVAGNGINGYSGDGGLATQAQVWNPNGLAVGPDGSLYIADSYNNRIRRVGPDGIITTVAGNGSASTSGDGLQATLAAINYPLGLVVAKDNSLYIAEGGYGHRIRKVDEYGFISTFAGSGPGDPHFAGDNGPATLAKLNAPYAVAITSDDDLIISDSSNSRIRRVSQPLPGVTLSDFLISSEDGSQVYYFNSAGRHLRTLHALTGAVLYQFEYDANGLLIAIEDGDHNITTIERSYNDDPVAIISPFGQRTDLSLDANGYLASITNPANEITRFSYSVDGLLEIMTDPLNRIHTFSYDSLGRLIRDEDPAGGFKVLERTEIADGYEVSVTTAMDRVTTYRTEDLTTGGIRAIKIEPSGAVTDIVIDNGGKKVVTSPDGTVTTIVNGPDPRFGMLSPVLNSLTITSPDNITRSITSSYSATLSDPLDLFSLQGLHQTLTENGQTFVYDYDASTRSFTSTTPAGHQTVTQLDEQGRAVNISLASGVDPIVKTYDLKGRLVQVKQGVQLWNYGYDTLSRISSRTDASSNSLLYAYDNANRVTSMTLPEGGIERYGYDANGNQTQMTMPSEDIHTLGYTVRDLLAAYTPPDSSDFSRVYDLDKSLVRLTQPSGRITLNSFDSSGRNTRINYPEALIDIVFNDATDRVNRLTRAPTDTGINQQLDFSYDGEMIKSMNWSGGANGDYQYSYDNNFRINQITLSSGSDTVQQALIRDADGLVTGFGSFALTRGGPGGSVSQLSDSKLSKNIAYDSHRRTESRSDTVNGIQTYSFTLTHDTRGRISQKTETVAGVTKTYDYDYDKNGQLIDVKTGSTSIESYSYDLNGNRLSRLLETASYDSQDRLTRHGAINYQFDLDGFLSTRGNDSFQYSARGELLKVVLNGGANTITYSYDGLARQVARTDSSGTYQYLYGNPDNPVQITAIRDTGNVLTTLYYDEDGFLYALDRGGNRYYVSTDQVGSPLVISDATGSIVKTIFYDSFGRRISDSNPAFELAVGFAGGLEDIETGLVRFGFRDYDQISGRWTARDPVLYDGGQINLYVYVGNNPISHRDPLGLWCVGGSFYLGVGGGAQLCCSGGKCSICAEGGLGIGISAEIGSGNASNTGTSVEGEVGAACGPASAGIKCIVSTDPCSTGCEAGGNIGPLGLNSKGEVKASKDLVKFKPKCGFQAKLAAKGCGKF